MNYIFGWLKTINIFAFTGWMLVKLLLIKTFIKSPQRTEREFEKIKRSWGDGMFSRMGMKLEIRGQPSSKAAIFVGNHISYLDIPALYKAGKVSFVSKAEVKKWPIIGTAATAVKTIYVDRTSLRSREETFKQIAKEASHGQRIVLFPSGTTSISDEKKWKRGAFKIAESQDLQMQAFRIRYEPLRQSAYIDDDFILTHIFNLARSKSKKRCIVEFGETFLVKNTSDDILRTQEWCSLNIWS